MFERLRVSAGLRNVVKAGKEGAFKGEPGTKGGKDVRKYPSADFTFLGGWANLAKSRLV